MGIIKGIAGYAIAKAKKSRLMQSLFEAPIDLKTMTVKGRFIDNSGIEFILYNELRSKIKPGWENMFKKSNGQLNSSPEIIAANAKNGRLTVERIMPLINTYLTSLKCADILEIGCHYGSVIYSLCGYGANSLTATDYSGYKASSVDKEHNAGKPSESIDDELTRIRKEVATHFPKAETVKFYDDDITDSKLPSDSYNLIISFDVLEHIKNPLMAFEHINRILKPGGIAIHEYNPFFSLNGGHSACTLDFPWGHVRLKETDFSRYIKEIRPSEYNKSISFYTEGLNRMCLADLKSFSIQAGLNVMSVVEFGKEQHCRMLDSEIYNQCLRNYNNISLSDLVTPKILVIQQKPK
jgi:SAM-dependent methyltransferase